MGCVLMTIHEKGYAKLNYSLDVRAKRADGYHDLTMVMGSVSLWDDVEVSLRGDGRIEARCSLPWLPRDGRNLAVRAARVFFEEQAEDPARDAAAEVLHFSDCFAGLFKTLFIHGVQHQ